ncbi:MAG TPA: HIRAN domain-containing protein [Terriglobia bacterium]|nr:HIRAN domain-containing protein [Terriglobia bacterium]
MDTTILVLAILFLILLVVGAIGRQSKKGLPESQAQPNVIVRTAEARPATSSAGNRLFYKKLAGITFKNQDGSSRQKVIQHCRVGEELVLVLEPTNPYDADAIKVCRANGEQLGYWPADGRMADSLRTGWTYRATVDRLYPFVDDYGRRKPGVGVVLQVEVLTMSRRTEERKKKAKT